MLCLFDANSARSRAIFTNLHFIKMYRFFTNFHSQLQILILSSISILFCNHLHSQNQAQENYIADVIENLEGNEDFDYNILFETLEYFSNNPINVNTADADEFAELLFLDQSSINAILRYRDEQGKFISIYELQAVPSLTVSDIRQILPFISINSDDNRYQLPLSDMLSGGNHELFLRYTSTLEQNKGQTLDDNGEKRYEGNNDNYYLRYRYNFDNRLSFGLTAEKDQGESFFAKSNKQGFDFYSIHVHLKDVLKNVKDLAIGDYSISFGQGLIAHNYFGGSKSSLVTNIKKGGRTIRPYTSKNEANFFRGIAATYSIDDHIDITAFGSFKNNDGNVIEIDTFEVEDNFNRFSSIREDGFHRTENEIEDENAIKRFSGGSRINYKKSSFSIGGNILYEKFDQFLQPQDQLANLFRFNGTSLLNGSIDYSVKLKNINLFGELAFSQNGGRALMSGALITLNRKTDLALLYRDYGTDYQNLNSNSFGESTTTNNEKGIYIGLRYAINNNWTINAYADQWSNPWIRFRVDGPSRGKEYLLKIDYSTRNSFNASAQYRYESKLRNQSDNETRVDIPINISLHKIRYSHRLPLSRKIELRNRIEITLFEDDNKSKGIFIAQDFHYKQRKFGLTSRIAYFNTEDFDSRIYAYESDLLYNFFIPFFQNEGIRMYANFKYKWTFKLSTEFRFARSQFFDIDTIGSGNNLIIGKARTDIKFQLRYRF